QLDGQGQQVQSLPAQPDLAPAPSDRMDPETAGGKQDPVANLLQSQFTSNTPTHLSRLIATGHAGRAAQIAASRGFKVDNLELILQHIGVVSFILPKVAVGNTENYRPRSP